MDDRWEPEITEYGAINITGFRIVDTERRYVREFLDGWKRLDPTTSVGAGKESITVSVSLCIYMYVCVCASENFSLQYCAIDWCLQFSFLLHLFDFMVNCVNGKPMASFDVSLHYRMTSEPYVDIIVWR